MSHKNHYIKQPEFQSLDMASLKEFIGKRVTKIHAKDCNPKPFKSTFQTNVIKDVVDHHPELHIPAFTFVEDDSYVACKSCLLVN